MNERTRALQLLRRIEAESLYASLVLLDETGFVRTAVLGVLRWRSRLDWTIAQLAKRSISKIDRSVVDVLRLGLYQVLYMDVPKYAAVGESVELAMPKARGFVNAVLRRAAAGPLPEPEELAPRTAHPRWMIERWQRWYGEERTRRIAEANQELSYPDVMALGDHPPPDGEPSRLVDGVWKLKRSTADLDRSEFYPLDEGSAVVAAIARNCGGRVLDLAAAPGSKTIYMLSRGASVVSADVSLPRLRHLTGRTRRIVAADGRRLPFRERFPVVLLDAPCSATGTIRKSPEIKWRLREQDLAGFAALQRELLASALDAASEAVVYSTCSLEREECDDVVNAVLASRDDFEIADAAPFVPSGAKEWVENRVLRLTPESGADGFTAFVLQRRS